MVADTILSNIHQPSRPLGTRFCFICDWYMRDCVSFHLLFRVIPDFIHYAYIAYTVGANES